MGRKAVNVKQHEGKGLRTAPLLPNVPAQFRALTPLGWVGPPQNNQLLALIQRAIVEYQLFAAPITNKQSIQCN